jgi:hypothetical protein
VTAHSEMIAYLAKIGRERGHDIWIGQREQRDDFGSGVAQTTSLRELVTVKKPAKLDGVTNLTDVLLMDLLWLEGSKVVHAFEVESTTMMTSGLQRGSNLPKATPKIMVIPEDRERDLERKMESPLFSQHFSKDGWDLLFFGALREAFARGKAKTLIASLLGQKKSAILPSRANERSAETQNLFLFGAETQPLEKLTAKVAEEPPVAEGTG